MTVYPDISITKQELDTRYNDWINEEKIIAAFKGFESKKSPGPDKLKPVTLKHLSLSMIKSIKMIYKVSIMLHFTPTKWKSSKIVYITKVGKDDYAQAKSYRPISLMNYLLKGLERHMKTLYYKSQQTWISHKGGVCSAKFWIIAFDEAAKILNSNGELFADDGNGIIGGKDVDYMAQRLNRVCRDLSQWGKNAV